VSRRPLRLAVPQAESFQERLSPARGPLSQARELLSQAH
jgi:hypothetical protein